MANGTVNGFNDQKGFGFIEQEDAEGTLPDDQLDAPKEGVECTQRGLRPQAGRQGGTVDSLPGDYIEGLAANRPAPPLLTAGKTGPAKRA